MSPANLRRYKWAAPVILGGILTFLTWSIQQAVAMDRRVSVIEHRTENLTPTIQAMSLTIEGVARKLDVEVVRPADMVPHQ